MYNLIKFQGGKMRIFLSMILFISFAFSNNNLIYSKYSKEFLEKNVLPSLQNEDLKTYYVNCYEKLVYSDDEISNNGWIIPEECNMFKYPIKSNYENKILQIGKINKDKINLLKEQIYKIKEKQKEVQDKLQVVVEKTKEKEKEKDPSIIKETEKDPQIIIQNYNEVPEPDFLQRNKYIIISILMFFIILLLFLQEIKFYFNMFFKNKGTYKQKIQDVLKNISDKIEVYKKAKKEASEIRMVSNQIAKEEKQKSKKAKKLEIQLKNDDEIILEGLINNEEEEECAPEDQECICKKYNLKLKKERLKNV